MIDIEGGPPWIVILIRKGLMEWPWRSGLLGCENLESGRALGKAPTPLREKSFKAQKEGIEASNRLLRQSLSKSPLVRQEGRLHRSFSRRKVVDLLSVRS